MPIILAPATKCPECGEEKSFVLKKEDAVTREADIHCGRCGAYVRMLNAS